MKFDYLRDCPTARDDDPVGVTALASGVVTFLLTDVEGSTRMWEGDEDIMRASIARHYELLDAAITLHDGVRPIEQGEGDSVVGAFVWAPDAVAAAFDAQRAFAEEPWPEGAVLRIRVALHTGEAQLRDKDYYVGRAIIRCARLRAVARPVAQWSHAALVTDHAYLTRDRLHSRERLPMSNG
jgi:class 3 adenylate cyclase